MRRAPPQNIEITPTRRFSDFRRRAAHQHQDFIHFRFSEFSGHMTPPVVASQRIRVKFVLRFDHTDRKEKARKLVEKYGWAKRIHRFQENRP